MNPSIDRAVRRGAVAVIVILLAIVSLTSLVLSNPTWRERARRTLGWEARFDIGVPSGLPNEWHQGAKPTVVIFISGTCEACRTSAPFHRALRAEGAASGFRVVTALTSASDDPSAYAAAESLPATDVVKFDFMGSRLRLVPTVVIVDPRGVVLEMKEGVLPESEQHALHAMIETLRKLFSL